MIMSINTGRIIPISLETLLVLAYSIIIKSIPQTTSVARIATKLKKDTFKNLLLAGTKKNMIVIRAGTKKDIQKSYKVHF